MRRGWWLATVAGVTGCWQEVPSGDTAVGARLRALEEADAEHEAELQALAQKDAEHEAELQALSKKDAEHDAEIAQLQADVTTLTERVGTLEETLGELADRLSTVEGEVDTTSTELGEAKADLGEAQGQLDEVDIRISALETAGFQTESDIAAYLGAQDYVRVATAGDSVLNATASNEVELRSALEALDAVRIPEGLTARIIVPATIVMTAPLSIAHPDGARISIIGSESDPSAVELDFSGLTGGITVRRGAFNLSALTLRGDAGIGLDLEFGASARLQGVTFTGWDLGVVAAYQSNVTYTWELSGVDPRVVFTGNDVGVALEHGATAVFSGLTCSENTTCASVGGPSELAITDGQVDIPAGGIGVVVEDGGLATLNLVDLVGVGDAASWGIDVGAGMLSATDVTVADVNQALRVYAGAGARLENVAITNCGLGIWLYGESWIAPQDVATTDANVTVSYSGQDGLEIGSYGLAWLPGLAITGSTRWDIANNTESFIFATDGVWDPALVASPTSQPSDARINE